MDHIDTFLNFHIYKALYSEEKTSRDQNDEYFTHYQKLIDSPFLVVFLCGCQPKQETSKKQSAKVAYH
jgi:hypothetical protein